MLDWTDALEFLVFAILVAVVVFYARRWNAKSIKGLCSIHFRTKQLDTLVISQRVFPYRVRADVQRAIDQLLGHFQVHRVWGFSADRFQQISTAEMFERGHKKQPLRYQDVDVGEREPVRCLECAMWLLSDGDARFSLLMTPSAQCGTYHGVSVEFAEMPGDGAALSKRLFKQLETEVGRAPSYRGKILSLESTESYGGSAIGVLVHPLKSIDRDQVVLPDTTLELLDRNVLGFVRQRRVLQSRGQSLKKGLLFYGPPGTGKTHTIHYLMSHLADHTTLLITAAQVTLLADYMTLARLLQPCLVVIEDVDLIGRTRTNMNAPLEQALLNELLNEMDGLREDAEILFILTTNRPESLEAALASRPGRIDQAIEFPIPDESGRVKLIELYGRDLKLPSSLVQIIAGRTENVSAAFIKELMRRSVQFQLERDPQGEVRLADIDLAIDELLFKGGALNLKLLGAKVVEDRHARAV